MFKSRASSHTAKCRDPRLRRTRDRSELKAEIFEAGENVDVTAHSKGKGFQGLIKTTQVQPRPRSHGSMNVRQPGAIGSTTRPRFQGPEDVGQMGNVRVTARAYKIVRVDPERNLLLLKGGVPARRALWCSSGSRPNA